MRLDLRAAHQTYRNKAGEKVPGVTTVCDVLAKPFLLPWYASQEYEGIMATMRATGGSDIFDVHKDQLWSAASLDRVLPRNKDGKRTWFAVQKRDKAADLGTVAHARIHARLIGDELDKDGLGDLWDKATPAVDRFFEWVDDRIPVIGEHQMVSEYWQVGGTLDHVFLHEDKPELWDIKTGKPWYRGVPYDEQFAQVAAYAAMYEETTGRTVGDIYIARVGNTEGDKGDLYPLTWKQRQAGLRLFEAALAAFKAKRLLSGWEE